MRKFDKIFLGILIGAVSPILFFLLGWWISIPFVPENKIYIYALAGLSIGITLDLIFLKKWIQIGYRLNKFIQILIYLFYTICVFGFFMGVPIFNILNGIIAGIYTGRKVMYEKLEKEKGLKRIRKASIFTTIIILFVSVFSACIALIDPSTGSNLKRMFNLNFEVTKEMICGVIFFGDLGLVLVQYWVTKITGLLILKHGKYFA